MAGKLVATTTDVFQQLGEGATDLEPSLIKGEQSNTSVIYGNHFILKLFRKVDEGMNPDLEIGRFLTEKKLLEHFASVAGSLEYRRPKAEPIIVGILQEFISDTRSSWEYTLDSLRDYFDHITVQQTGITEVPVPSDSQLSWEAIEVPELASQTIGTYLSSAQLLGQRTAELHIALASAPDNPDFAPEPFSTFYQRSIYQYARNLTGQVLLLLKKRLTALPPNTQNLAKAVLNRQEQIMGCFQLLRTKKSLPCVLVLMGITIWGKCFIRVKTSSSLTLRENPLGL
jgi:maltose alpha-D-glucosyltransferase/alpha-amylase